MEYHYDFTVFLLLNGKKVTLEISFKKGISKINV